MKKLLFLMGKLNGGGAEKVLLDTVNNLPPDKYDITVFLVENEGVYIRDLAPHIHFRAITDSHAPLRKKWFYRFFYYLELFGCYAYFLPGRYDVEIAFLEGLATHIIGCSSRKNTRKIAWVHTDMFENRWSDVDFKSEKQQAEIYRRFNDVVCVSEIVKSQFTRRFGKIGNETVLYNVVNDQQIKEKAMQSVNANIGKKRFTIASSGRFTRQKGFDRLLKIHKRLLETGYEHDLWLIGDGGMRAELEEYVAKHNLQGSVRFWGFQSNPYPIMAAADLFVCSSRSEGYSTVVTEAFILDVPVVSVMCSGAGELLQNGKFGLLVENDDDSLYDGLRLILSDKKIYVRYKELAQKRGRDFTMKKRLEELQVFLDK